MPFADFARYSAGITPSGDVAAQKRSYDYLRSVTSALNKKVSTSDDPTLRSQLSTNTSVQDFLQPFAGAYTWSTAAKFWKYWDKNKRQIIAAGEGISDEEAIMDVVARLEDGRYTPS